jgi:hypothetical protein
MNITDDITTLEKYLLPIGNWINVPEECGKIATNISEEYGGNVGIGYHDEIGFFVLHDQGYGIGLVWKEKNGN